ncbi:MAG: hypothetical protein Q4B04_05235 [bacterium]|nr:hypothetical protein [bacterium]
MTISEKVSYIKGLADGLELDNNGSNKILSNIIDVLEDIALSISDIEDTCAEMGEQLDAVDEDLSAIEDDFYDDCDCDCDCDDDFCYEVECPNCNNVIYLDDEMIDEGEICCPNCDTQLEFDFDCDCDCDCDDSGCDCCHDSEKK